MNLSETALELQKIYTPSALDNILNFIWALSVMILIWTIGYLIGKHIESKKYDKQYGNLGDSILDRYKKKKK